MGRPSRPTAFQHGHCLSGTQANQEVVVYTTADEAVAYMFYRCFFLFFFVFAVHQKYETTVLGNG